MNTKLIALGPEQTKVTEQRQVVTCILCQEEQEVKVDNRAMVLAAFIQRSTVLSKNRNKVTPDPGKWRTYCSIMEGRVILVCCCGPFHLVLVS